MKNNFILPLIVVILLILSFTLPTKFLNKNNTSNKKSNLILFYGQGCPHCANVEKFLSENKVKEKISIEEKEVYYNPRNSQLLINIARKCGFNDNQIGVPFLWDEINNKCIVGDEPIISFFKERLSNE
jgi:glutaredoxin